MKTFYNNRRSYDATKPLVSIIMPVYNEEKYIRKSIESILQQTYSHLELVIINDASSDETQAIIDGFKDNRITSIVNKNNIGVVASLNLAIKHSSGKYIARMDADDISLPKRLEKQVSLLESDQEIVVCGTGHFFLNYLDNDFRAIQPISNDSDIRKQMLTHSPLNTGTAMYRRAALVKVNSFSLKDKKAEGFSLLIKLSSIGKISNVTEPLYIYFLRANGENRSANNNFKGRNEAMSEMTSRMRKMSIKSIVAPYAWQYYHLAPLFLKKILRLAFSKKTHTELSIKKIKELEGLYSN